MVLHRRLVVSAAAAFALALAPGTAWAGDPVEVTVAKHAGGPFQTGEPGVHINSGHAKDLYIRSANIGTGLLKPTLTEITTPPSIAYKLRWFKGKHAITNQVRGAGYDYKLKPGKRQTFRLSVEAKQMPGEACVGGRFAASGDPDDFGLFELNAAPGFCSG